MNLFYYPIWKFLLFNLKYFFKALISFYNICNYNKIKGPKTKTCVTPVILEDRLSNSKKILPCIMLPSNGIR